MKKIEVALIHNNDASRNAPMRKVIASLERSSPKNLKIEIGPEISWQPNGLQSTLTARFQWALANSKTAHVVARARQETRKLGVLRASLVGPAFFVAYLFSELRDALTDRNFSARHRQVSRKHHLAWTNFLSSRSAEWLLVLEDDALFTRSGLPEFWKVAAEVQDRPADLPVFVLLSEGINLEDLGLDESFFSHHSDALLSPAIPFTNTAAGYLMNRPMTRYFVETVEQRKTLLSNNVDFLINNLLTRQYKSSSKDGLACFHATHPPFQNASINGSYKSHANER